MIKFDKILTNRLITMPLLYYYFNCYSKRRKSKMTAQKIAQKKAANEYT